jgi:hypothetical protein
MVNMNTPSLFTVHKIFKVIFIDMLPVIENGGNVYYK